MGGPFLHRSVFLFSIGSALVDARDPRFVPTYMIDYGLDDMRLNANFSLAANNSSAQIVEALRRETTTPIEAFFRFTPTGKWTIGFAQKKLPFITFCNLPKNGKCLLRERHIMRSFILSPLRGDRPQRSFNVNFVPASSCDFLASLASH